MATPRRLLLSHLKDAGFAAYYRRSQFEAAIAAVAAEFGFDHRVFALSDPRKVDEGLRGVSVLLNACRPFSAHRSTPN